ncbi:ParB N-terminal domain-containing protein [Paracoccus nototheniae]|uniref:ParB N-terminal domain-containing protein n=1 Tax=Paracoccus nototheniae TaxID=2489002 RepID=A0ABW4DV56_9RHOB|nr:ParB N-terminal domain-containing protein [Paracoccus nototheniae]
MEHFRRIDVSGLPPAEMTVQPPPRLLWVEISSLVIDDRYQRPLGPANWSAIKRMAAEFRWSRFSPVVVAEADGGRYALIDGQHRAHAAALCGLDRIPAMVTIVPEREQAAAFIDINTRQIAVRSQNVYRAALEAGEEWALRCRRAVEAAGCRMMTSNASSCNRKPGQVFTIDLIRTLTIGSGAQHVTHALAALLEFDPKSAANFSADMLRPFLAAAVATKAAPDELSAVLRARRPWIVIEDADRRAKVDRQPRAAARREAFVDLMKAARRAVS